VLYYLVLKQVIRQIIVRSRIIRSLESKASPSDGEGRILLCESSASLLVQEKRVVVVRSRGKKVRVRLIGNGDYILSYERYVSENEMGKKCFQFSFCFCFSWTKMAFFSLR
jgi:hypothetical protein